MVHAKAQRRAKSPSPGTYLKGAKGSLRDREHSGIRLYFENSGSLWFIVAADAPCSHCRNETVCHGSCRVDILVHAKARRRAKSPSSGTYLKGAKGSLRDRESLGIRLHFGNSADSSSIVPVAVPAPRISGRAVLIPATCYLLPNTCYLLPATCYQLPDTSYQNKEGFVERQPSAIFTP